VEAGAPPPIWHHRAGASPNGQKSDSRIQIGDHASVLSGPAHRSVFCEWLYLIEGCLLEEVLARRVLEALRAAPWLGAQAPTTSSPTAATLSPSSRLANLLPSLAAGTEEAAGWFRLLLQAPLLLDATRSRQGRNRCRLANDGVDGVTRQWIQQQPRRGAAIRRPKRDEVRACAGAKKAIIGCDRRVVRRP
jgi:hypothetical protein